MYICCQRGAPGAAAATSSSDVVAAIDTTITVPAAAAARAVAGSPSSHANRCIAVGATATGVSTGVPSTVVVVVDVGHVTQHMRAEPQARPRGDVRSERDLVADARRRCSRRPAGRAVARRAPRASRGRRPVRPGRRRAWSPGDGQRAPPPQVERARCAGARRSGAGPGDASTSNRQRDTGLEAGERGTRAEVRAEAEAEVALDVVGAAIEPVLLGVVEHGLRRGSPTRSRPSPWSSRES